MPSQQARKREIYSLDQEKKYGYNVFHRGNNIKHE